MFARFPPARLARPVMASNLAVRDSVQRDHQDNNNNIINKSKINKPFKEESYLLFSL